MSDAFWMAFFTFLGVLLTGYVNHRKADEAAAAAKVAADLAAKTAAAVGVKAVEDERLDKAALEQARIDRFPRPNP